MENIRVWEAEVQDLYLSLQIFLLISIWGLAIMCLLVTDGGIKTENIMMTAGRKAVEDRDRGNKKKSLFKLCSILPTGSGVFLTCCRISWSFFSGRSQSEESDWDLKVGKNASPEIQFIRFSFMMQNLNGKGPFSAQKYQHNTVQANKSKDNF